VLCNECVGAHRSLGVHVSKPLSLKVDAWDKMDADDQQAYTLSQGNAAVNADYEVHEHAASSKPAPSDCLEVKVAYVKSKYANRACTAGGDGVLACCKW